MQILSGDLLHKYLEILNKLNNILPVYTFKEIKKMFDSNNRKINYGVIVLTAVAASIVSAFVTYKAMGTSSAKIAVIDINRVVLASKEINAFTQEFNNNSKILQKMLADADAKIKAEKNEAKKKKMTEQYSKEISAKRDEYRKIYNTNVRAAEAKLNDIINAVAEKEGLDIVINKSNVMKGGTDITDAVVEQVR